MKQFDALITSISSLDLQFKASMAKAINTSLTLRNWLIGMYIVEYEQHGEDRAKYGDKIEATIAHQLNERGFSERNLKLYKRFFLAYPQISQSLNDLLPLEVRQSLSFSVSADEKRIMQSPTALLTNEDKKKVQSLTASLQTAESQNDKLKVPAHKLVTKLSFTHLAEVLKVSDPFTRTFYEIECIKSTWSVRELKRQINSLYYERSGLSKHPEKLAAKLQETIEPKQPQDILKNIYTFEFLGLPTKDLVEENDLETALMDHLQDFILELGDGFCFEGRQKKILIGDEYYFVDLVFYHRILKCHVLLELKVGAFDHANAGQLNTYINYYNAEVKQDSDNPTIGILLVANKNQALVTYATAGMDEKLFVQKYMVQLPSKDLLEKHINQELSRL